MFQGSRARRQGRAHRARPGGRRHDERHDLARPDELLRDAAGPPARPGAVARGRPDGDAARRAQPGEPRQPARGRQEREALVLRQPAVRLVAGEAPGPPLPAGAPVPPLDDRLDGGPRRGLARGRERLLPDLLRAEQRGRCRSSATSRRRPSVAAAERYFGAIPANPAIPPLGDLSLPPTLGGEIRETVHDRVPLPRIYVGFRAPVFGDPRLDALEVAGQILAGREGQPAPPPARPRGADRPGRRALHARASSAARRSAPAGRPSGRASTVERVEAAFHEELERLADRARHRRRAGPRAGAHRGRRARAPSSGSRSAPTGCRCTRRCSTIPD